MLSNVTRARSTAVAYAHRGSRRVHAPEHQSAGGAALSPPMRLSPKHPNMRAFTVRNIRATAGAVSDGAEPLRVPSGKGGIPQIRDE